MHKIWVSAFLAVLLTACDNAAVEAPSASADDESSATPGLNQDWPVHGGTTNEQRFSPLDRINRQTVADLKPAWYVDFDTNRAQEATPIVIDGVLYTSTAWSKVYAVNAKTGEQIWYYDPKVPGVAGYKACCDVNNRGLAVQGGKVFLATLDGRMQALDAATGELLWSTMTVDETKNYTITGAPRVMKGKVLVGNAGGEFGVRGYVSAYDTETGALAWRFYVVPGDPAQEPDGAASDRAMAEIALPTWAGKWYEYGGGGTVWDAIVYDEELDQVYVGTGNGSPWSRRQRSAGQGDNLFLSSVLALDPDTGEYLWHYQESPGDSWDYTSVQPMMLMDLTIGGEARKALLHAPKNGFFYVLDRLTGKVISANPFVPTSWATHVDLATGRPAIAANAFYDDGPFLGTPSAGGGHNWSPWSFSPRTGLVYFQAQEAYLRYQDDPNWEYSPTAFNIGQLRTPELAAEDARNSPPFKSYVLGWDPVENKERMRIDGRGGGVLATAGDLLFQARGTTPGELVAFDAVTGEQVWSYPLPNSGAAAPISYAVDGEQFIAIPLGRNIFGGNDIDARMPQPGRLVAFKLGGTATLPEPPPPAGPANPPSETFADDVVRAGELIYFDHCSRCHGNATRGPNILPDLRRSAALTNPALWRAIVLDGALLPRGMIGWSDFMDATQVESIRAFVGREAVRLAQQQAAAAPAAPAPETAHDPH
jgi:quinohemoprotein ethanol dehydrogenase